MTEKLQAGTARRDKRRRVFSPKPAILDLLRDSKIRDAGKVKKLAICRALSLINCNAYMKFFSAHCGWR
jgi:hypothetical protein